MYSTWWCPFGCIIATTKTFCMHVYLTFVQCIYGHDWLFQNRNNIIVSIHMFSSFFVPLIPVYFVPYVA